MKVAILCGGLATRLSPLTDHQPKSLIDVNGIPFVVRQLFLLREQGLREVVLCVGWLGDDIQEVVGTGFDFGMELIYSSDPVGRPLGTAGALRNALPLLGETFYVLYGDSYLDACNFRDVATAFRASGRLALMTVCRSDRVNCIYDNGKIALYDKQVWHPHMNRIDYGLSIMHRSALDGNESDLADVFHKLSECRQLAGYDVPEKYHSIGSFEGLEETRNYLKGKR